MKRKDIFRDTNTLYLDWDNYASDNLLDFVVRNGGKKILDVGCSVGDYVQRLGIKGFECIGIDYNPKYIEKARNNNIETYVMDACQLGFTDNSFDTVIMFEVLEHLEHPQMALIEAGRVARKNILITTPSFSDYEKLKDIKLTYYDALDVDHVNLFSKDELSELCREISSNTSVLEDEPINFHSLLPWYVSKPISLLYKLKILRPTIFRRLYAVIGLDEAID